jgi:hypothetical protein
LGRGDKCQNTEANDRPRKSRAIARPRSAGDMIQILQWREARDAASFAALGDAFHWRFRVWFALGIGAFAAVIAIYWLMVTKTFLVT